MLAIKKQHTNACFEAWINCENLVIEMRSLANVFSKKALHLIDECAFVCMGTFHALKSGSVNASNMILLCVGICEECAEVCEMHNGYAFEECAKVCRDCANKLSQLNTAI